MSLEGTRIAILTAEDGVERVELTEPRRVLAAAGAEALHVTPEATSVRTFDQADPSHRLLADVSLEQ
jgi:deglycase